MIYKKIIITSGATKEWIDPVRFISNASTGKMGFHLAEEFSKYSSNIVFIRGSVNDKYSNIKNAKNIHVETTIGMQNALIHEIENDTLVIMAAAPADYRPKNISEQKIKKENSDFLTIELVKNPDILLTLKNYIEENKITNTFRIGFAAETENLEKNAISKLERKGLNYIIGNYVHKNETGFGENNSSIKIFSKSGIAKEILNQPKEILAFEIVDFLLSQTNINTQNIV